MKGFVLRLALLSGIALAAALPASARQLQTLDGGLMSLSAVVLPADLQSGRALQPSALRADIVWTYRDASGVESSGVLPGVGSVRDELPLLVQNPVDGEIHLIYSAVRQGSRDLFLRTWLGQSWSSAVLLAGDPDHDDVSPRAAFGPEGELLLGWRQLRPTADHVLFLYGQVDAGGVRVVHAHLDMGPAAVYTRPVDGDVQLSAGIAELRTDATGERALLFLADPVAEDAGVLRLDLRALRRIIGGGSFAPVPVNFLQVAMGTGGGLSDRIAEAGEVLPAWRVEVLEGEGYYWFDEETMSGLGFRGGAVRGELITLETPENEAVAHAVMLSRLRMAIGRIESQLEPILARRSAGDARR